MPQRRLCKDCLWLQLWTRRDEKRSVSAEWLLTKAMELKRPKNNKVLDEGNGTLFVQDNLERMYVVDLETGDSNRRPRRPSRWIGRISSSLAWAATDETKCEPMRIPTFQVFDLSLTFVAYHCCS